MIFRFFAFVFFAAQLCAQSSFHDWEASEIIQATARKPSRTAVLIIAAPLPSDHSRWNLGKNVWAQYMRTVPDVDCFFIIPTNPRIGVQDSEQVWIEGDTIFVGDHVYERHHRDRILHKTVAAIKFLLPNYTHFIRTNANTFLNLEAVSEYTKNHHSSFYTAFIWQNEWYSTGYGIFFTADVASHIVKEYKRLEGHEEISEYHADDCTLTSLAAGVSPFTRNLFRRCPSLPPGIRQVLSFSSISSRRVSDYSVMLWPPIDFDLAKKYCRSAHKDTMLYRVREGYSLEQLVDLYQIMLNKHYPQLTPSLLLE